jgi:hypothetical protein
MRKTAVTAAGLALSASLAGLVYAAPSSGAATEKSAVAATSSTSRTVVDDHGRGRHGADDPPGHVRQDDRREDRTVVVHVVTPVPKPTVVAVRAVPAPVARHGADDPANHDATDDRVVRAGTAVSDDPAGHEVGDDHGDRSGRSGSDDPAGHDAGDDRGSRGHGSDD